MDAVSLAPLQRRALSMNPKMSQAHAAIGDALVMLGLLPEKPSLVVSGINRGYMHVADLMPTLLEVAGTSYPKARDGRQLPALMGKSWGPMLTGQVESPRTTKRVFGQVFRRRATSSLISAAACLAPSILLGLK